MLTRCWRSACWLIVLAAGTAAAAPGNARAAAGLELRDGDRVVLLGSTLIEREGALGYLEAALATRFPGRDIQFRNLGWSGDTVFGLARAGFGDEAHGFAELKKQVAAISPTVILLNYGANESFAGEAGLAQFQQGLAVLLAALDEGGPRIVFMTPPPHEDLGRPLPDPTEHNRHLKLYRDALARAAAERGAPLVDLFAGLGDRLDPPGQRLTDNGIHLTPLGYWRAAPVVEDALGLGERAWQIEIDAPRGIITGRGTTVAHARCAPEHLRFTCRDRYLPLPPAPPGGSENGRGGRRVLRVYDLAPGTYALSIDAREIARAGAADWARGVPLATGPEFDQAESLRRLIVEKNELYFHRWRPQNVTYLFGFRKHEQGNNAVEIPQFDPLVAEREGSLRQLTLPVEHVYELTRVDATH